MKRLLLDANLSPRTRAYLVDTFGFDVTDLQTLQKGRIDDDEVIAIAKAEKRIIVTIDKDFGEAYYLHEWGNIGVIVLRLDDQTVESVNRTLYRFFTEQDKDIDLPTSLIIIEPQNIRIVRKEEQAA